MKNIFVVFLCWGVYEDRVREAKHAFATEDEANLYIYRVGSKIIQTAGALQKVKEHMKKWEKENPSPRFPHSYVYEDRIVREETERRYLEFEQAQLKPYDANHAEELARVSEAFRYDPDVLPCDLYTNYHYDVQEIQFGGTDE